MRAGSRWWPPGFSRFVCRRVKLGHNILAMFGVTGRSIARTRWGRDAEGSATGGHGAGVAAVFLGADCFEKVVGAQGGEVYGAELAEDEVDLALQD